MKRNINNDFFYCIARTLKSRNEQEFIKLIRAYKRKPIIIVDHNGEKYPDKNYYYISIADNESTINRGFYAHLANILGYLKFADKYNLIPIVYWGKYSVYYDSEKTETNNVFEYYDLGVKRY